MWVGLAGAEEPFTDLEEPCRHQERVARSGFARLWAASGVSNLGDGVYGTALPLLAATLTRDPLLISVVSFAEWLPWLLFGLLSGALLDRWTGGG